MRTIKLKAVPWTMEGFIEDLEKLAEDFDPLKSAEYTAFKTAAAYLKRFTADIPPDRLEKICNAERENRCVVLPNPLTSGDVDVIRDVGRIVNNLNDMQECIDKAEAAKGAGK